MGFCPMSKSKESMLYEFLCLCMPIPTTCVISPECPAGVNLGLDVFCFKVLEKWQNDPEQANSTKSIVNLRQTALKENVHKLYRLQRTLLRVSLENVWNLSLYRRKYNQKKSFSRLSELDDPFRGALIYGGHFVRIFANCNFTRKYSKSLQSLESAIESERCQQDCRGVASKPPSSWLLGSWRLFDK